MTDVLIYCLDYRKNAERPTWRWHTNARLLAGLQPGDRLWFVTSGLRLSQCMIQRVVVCPSRARSAAE
jgi:hypothetical protein